MSVAALAAEVARRASVPVDTAHLTGLLHDFGKLVMPLAFGEEELDELARAHPAEVERAAAEWERFGIDHAHAGALYASGSGVDEEICEAIAYHHGGRSGVRVPSPLAACVQVAEALSNVLSGTPPDASLIDEALGVLGLDAQILDDVAQETSVGPQPEAVPSIVGPLAAQVAELERRAHNDDLTGVLGRRAFIENARNSLGADQSGTLLLVDVDDFKSINDTLGHRAGDSLLTMLADVLIQHGLAGRLGGDEFALWLPGPNATGPEVARSVLAQADNAFVWTADGADQPVTGISIGVASAPGDGGDLATLLERADAALYDAKRAGGHGFAVFGEPLDRGRLGGQASA